MKAIRHLRLPKVEPQRPLAEVPDCDGQEPRPGPVLIHRQSGKSFRIRVKAVGLEKPELAVQLENLSGFSAFPSQLCLPVTNVSLLGR